MKLSNPWIIAVTLGCAASQACAQLQLIPDSSPPCVFGSAAQSLELRWHNAGGEMIKKEIRARVFQAGSSIVVQIGEVPWKTTQVLPQQTILESARLDFPTVKAETKFLVQWIGGTNQLLGRTEVWVYPTNLLGELKLLLGADNLGVLDPNNEIKPLLKQNGVEFLDLGERSLDEFRGKLAIIGPFHSKSQLREGLSQTIQNISAQGVAVVWLVPRPDR